MWKYIREGQDALTRRFRYAGYLILLEITGFLFLEVISMILTIFGLGTVGSIIGAILELVFVYICMVCGPYMLQKTVLEFDSPDLNDFVSDFFDEFGKEARRWLKTYLGWGIGLPLLCVFGVCVAAGFMIASSLMAGMDVSSEAAAAAYMENLDYSAYTGPILGAGLLAGFLALFFMCYCQSKIVMDQAGLHIGTGMKQSFIAALIALAFGAVLIAPGYIVTVSAGVTYLLDLLYKLILIYLLELFQITLLCELSDEKTKMEERL